MMQKQDVVLLTGVTGFLGSHTTIQLLEKGYKVIGTLRNKQRANDMLSVIGKHTANLKNLSFVEADLTDENILYSLCLLYWIGLLILFLVYYKVSSFP